MISVYQKKNIVKWVKGNVEIWILAPSKVQPVTSRYDIVKPTHECVLNNIYTHTCAYAINKFICYSCYKG